jgi:hypothetical protein
VRARAEGLQLMRKSLGRLRRSVKSGDLMSQVSCLGKAQHWRSSATLRACALVVLASCSPRQQSTRSAAEESPTGEPSLLPPAAYHLALDSLLAGARPEYQVTYVQGAAPIAQRDLQRRHLQIKHDRYVCPGEVALWFEQPVQREDGAVELEVVEAFGDRGLAGSRVFIFHCTDRLCGLVQAVPGNGDRLVLCQRVQRR